MRASRLSFTFPSTFALAFLAVTTASHAGADAQPQAVAVSASRAVGELPYRYFLEMQHYLEGHLPPGPRLVDLWFRVGTPGMTEAQRDAHSARGWQVAVRSRTVDAVVPLRRGTYFTLPEIKDAYDERGEIVVNGTYRPWLNIWWTLRVPGSRRMAYADIARARAQIRAVQDRVSAYAPSLQNVRRSPYDGIKACFLDGSGAILVDGRAVADAAEGDCKILYLDAAREARGEMVEFAGPLDVVSFIDRRYYAQAK